MVTTDARCNIGEREGEVVFFNAKYWDRKNRADLKADFQSVQFSERAEILLFAGGNVALKLNRYLRLSNFLLSKIPHARKIPMTGNWALSSPRPLVMTLKWCGPTGIQTDSA